MIDFYITLTAELADDTSLRHTVLTFYSSSRSLTLAQPYLGRGEDRNNHHLWVSVAFACGIQLAMSGLFTVMVGLEDPFANRVGRGRLDRVKVPELVEP